MCARMTSVAGVREEVVHVTSNDSSKSSDVTYKKVVNDKAKVHKSVH